MNSLKLLLRFATVGALLLLLLIPLSLIRGTIHEREAYRLQASERIARSSAGAQQVLAPLRVLPWTDIVQVRYTDEQGVQSLRTERRTGSVLDLPRTLDVQAELKPEARRIGVFEVRVYRLHAQLKAGFEAVPLAAPADGVERRWGQPYLVLGVSDVRGLVGTPVASADGRALRFEPGTRHRASSINGVSATLPAMAQGRAPASSVEMDFVLAGTESLSIVPLADSSHIAVHSSWPHPSFSGDFLPGSRTILPGEAGFNARWDISSLASKAQSQVRQLRAGDDSIERVTIGLVDPVDAYSQVDRASKYGILFVLLTFVGFALFELIRRLPIHPLQYLLVGLALAIFFLLLLSLSEHLAFWQAYLVSSIACIGLQFVYLSGVLRSRARATGFAAMLTALYGALYGLLASEDLALLMGSLLLFGILAAIMWITRRVDWYALGASLR